MKASISSRSIVILSLLLAACSGEQPAPTPPPQPTAEPAPAPAPDPEPEDGEGGAGGAADKPAPKPTAAEPPKPSGRPAILMGPSAAIEDQTFGSTPGAVLKLKGKDGIITWKIPELALYAGTNVTWKIHKLRGKSKHPLIGDIVYLKTVIGGKQKPQKISSSGPDFEFRWPTGGKDTFNLAVGEVAIGADGAEGDVTWTVVAPKNVDAGLKEAYFYLHDVGPILYLHATSAAATESAAAPAQ